MKENFGVGVDIESIDRFRGLELPKNCAFLEQVFTKRELEYCFSKADSAQYLAARFAGKEAVVKALSSMGERMLEFKKVEITNNDTGVPIVRLGSRSLGEYVVKISLAHCRDNAIAFAIARKT